MFLQEFLKRFKKKKNVSIYILNITLATLMLTAHKQGACILKNKIKNSFGKKKKKETITKMIKK